jgi:hypothetical protein
MKRTNSFLLSVLAVVIALAFFATFTAPGDDVSFAIPMLGWTVQITDAIPSTSETGAFSNKSVTVNYRGTSNFSVGRSGNGLDVR